MWICKEKRLCNDKRVDGPDSLTSKAMSLKQKFFIS